MLTIALPALAGEAADELVGPFDSLPVMQTKNLSMDLTYALRIGEKTSGQSTPELATYGMNATTKIGGKSSLKTLFFMSNPQNKAPGINHLAQNGGQQNTKQDAESGRMIVQEGEFGFGGMKLKLGYQDVSERFDGFSSLQETNAAPGEVLSILAREKGLKRLDVGAEVALGRGMSFSASTNQIMDKTDDIVSQSFGFSSSKIKLGFNTSEIGEGFTRFKDIREADRELMAKEKGIKRTGMQAGIDLGHGMALSATTSEIKDKADEITSRSIGFSSNKLKLDYSTSEVGENFTRARDLRESNREQLAKETGMKRTNIAGTLKLGAGDISLGFSKVADQSGASVLKQNFGFSGKNLNVQAKMWDVDQQARVADLVDPEKDLLMREQGFKGMSLATNYNFSSRVGIESFYYSSKNASAGRGREQFKNKLSYTTKYGAKISMFRDQFSSNSLDGKSSGYLHQWFRLEQAFKALGGLGFNGLHDTATTIDEDGNEVTAAISQMHLESNKNLRTFGVVDRKTVDFGNGKVENTQSFNLSSKLTKRLNLTSGLTSIDRGDDGSEEMRAYTLSGTLADRLAMFRDVKLATSRSVEDKQGALSKASDALKLEANVFRGNFVAEYSSAQDASGNKPMSRGLSFVSDRDEKKRLRFDVAYKTRDIGPGDPFAVRNYNVNYKLSDRTSLGYGYFSYREKQDGNVEPVGGATMNLSTQIRRFSVAANFKQDKNYANDTERSVYGLSISGKLSYGALVEVGYSLDDQSAPGSGGKGQTIKFKYDHPVDADHFLTLTSEYKTTNDAAPGTRKDLVASVDLRTVFH